MVKIITTAVAVWLISFTTAFAWQFADYQRFVSIGGVPWWETTVVVESGNNVCRLANRFYYGTPEGDCQGRKVYRWLEQVARGSRMSVHKLEHLYPGDILTIVYTNTMWERYQLSLEREYQQGIEQRLRLLERQSPSLSQAEVEDMVVEHIPRLINPSLEALSAELKKQAERMEDLKRDFFGSIDDIYSEDYPTRQQFDELTAQVDNLDKKVTGLKRRSTVTETAPSQPQPLSGQTPVYQGWKFPTWVPDMTVWMLKLFLAASVVIVILGLVWMIRKLWRKPQQTISESTTAESNASPALHREVQFSDSDGRLRSVQFPMVNGNPVSPWTKRPISTDLTAYAADKFWKLGMPK